MKEKSENLSGLFVKYSLIKFFCAIDTAAERYIYFTGDANVN
jgi:hypothetical protein